MTPAPATFRPPLRRLGPALLLGATAGAVLGLATRIPFPLGALFGATAAAISLAARHARGLRVVADERGLRVAGGPPVDATWPEIRLGFGLVQRADGVAQRYAIFADGRGRSFGFTVPGPGLGLPRTRGADGQPVDIAELSDAPLLLAIIVQRAPAWFVLPESLLAPPQAPPPAAEPEAEAGAAAGEKERPARPRGARLGPLALAAKLGSKLLASLGKVGAGLLKVAKTANLGWAVASAATWSLLFSWKFALALMVQLFVHEYGHIHAMRRTGMKVRGLYFVPFLGAMAVTEDAFTSRRQQAYVALNGPLWGSALALVPFGLWAWTGDPTCGAVAAWWALINLFNLLPIAPLDGGRVLHAFAHSYSSSLGMALSVLGLVGAVALATYVGFSLIWLVAALGAMELAAESQVRTGVRALRLLPEPGRFGVPHWLYLRAALGPGGGAGGEGAFLRILGRQQVAARAEPLRPLEIVAWGLVYAGLAAALVMLVWFMRHAPGAEAAGMILG
jgi:Zn-dependent protease